MGLILPIKPDNYLIRVINSSFMNWVLIIILFVAFLKYQNSIGYVICGVLFVISTIRQAIWSRYNLLNYKVDNGTVTFEYQDFNKVELSMIEIDSLKLEWEPLLSKDKRQRVKFYSDDEYKFSQYCTGDWQLGDLKKFLSNLYKDIDREPSIETKINITP